MARGFACADASNDGAIFYLMTTGTRCPKKAIHAGRIAASNTTFSV
jgi:hypothetical protein